MRNSRDRVSRQEIFCYQFEELLEESAPYHRVLEGANITQDSARVRKLQDTVVPVYIEWILRTPELQKAMQRAIKGVAVRGINIGDVRALQIPLPSYEEQREIVQQIGEAFEADQ